MAMTKNEIRKSYANQGNREIPFIRLQISFFKPPSK